MHGLLLGAVRAAARGRVLLQLGDAAWAERYAGEVRIPQYGGRVRAG